MVSEYYKLNITNINNILKHCHLQIMFNKDKFLYIDNYIISFCNKDDIFYIKTITV